MIERPIQLPGSAVRAILGGRKTQLRRVVEWPHWADEGLREVIARNPGALVELTEHRRRRMRAPYGVAGDRLWVRETWCPVPTAAARTTAAAAVPTNDTWYEADGVLLPPQCHWQASIRLPRHCCRLLLEVRDVRIERLQDISARDAMAEGLEPLGTARAKNEWFRPGGWASDGAGRPRLVFADLWDSTVDRRRFGWATNPWVWVVLFHPLQVPAASGAAASG